MAASEVGVPATAVARSTRSRTSAGISEERTSRHRRSAPRAHPVPAGRSGGAARCGGPSPSAWTRGTSGSPPGTPTTYSVLPPPMSITRVGVSPASTPAVAPLNVRRASSSPEMVRTSTRWRCRSASTRSAALRGVAHCAGGHGDHPLRAEPVDDLPVLRRRPPPPAPRRRRTAARTRPRPRRGGSRVVLRSSCSTRPSRTRATSRRVELVPRSITAIGGEVIGRQPSARK